MESLISFLSTLNSLTPLALAGLLGTVIFLMVYKNPFKPIENKLNEVTTNHLHELPEISENLKKAVEILGRIEVKQAEDFSYIKAKLSNGNKYNG